jgi:hypothetical protein
MSQADYRFCNCQVEAQQGANLFVESIPDGAANGRIADDRQEKYSGVGEKGSKHVFDSFISFGISPLALAELASI